MLGVGKTSHPKRDDDNEQHLWKSVERGESSETYCGEFTVDVSLNDKGMTQVDKNNIERWKEQEFVCDACVEVVEERYTP